MPRVVNIASLNGKEEEKPRKHKGVRVIAAEMKEKQESNVVKKWSERDKGERTEKFDAYT